MIGFRTEMRAVGGPSKKSSKKSICFWLGRDILIDQATMAPLKGAAKGLLVRPIVLWKPVVLPIAWQESGHEGTAGAAAPRTTVLGAASAVPRLVTTTIAAAKRAAVSSAA